MNSAAVKKKIKTPPPPNANSDHSPASCVEARAHSRSYRGAVSMLLTFSAIQRNAPLSSPSSPVSALYLFLYLSLSLCSLSLTLRIKESHFIENGESGFYLFLFFLPRPGLILIQYISLITCYILHHTSVSPLFCSSSFLCQRCLPPPSLPLFGSTLLPLPSHLILLFAVM